MSENYRVISITEYQPVSGVEAPKEQLFKVTFWHLDEVHQGVMITGLPDNYDEKWLQERIEDFVNNPLLPLSVITVIAESRQQKPGPSETKDAINKT